eukprot:s2427_g13.t1
MCIHSASAPDAAYDRYAGVMVMLSKQHFQDPAVHEIHKGRVLHVRATHKLTQTRIDVLAVYQHVWRSHLSTQQNHDLRGAVWQHLHDACARLPARNFLLLCGDFNATVQPERYAAGPASLPSDANYPDRQLNRLLAAHSLCALNTWHASPAYTHYSHTGQTQIDFVITRRSTAGQASKQARPLVDFPVAGWRLSSHLPIQAALSVVPVHWRADLKSNRPVLYDKNALHAATKADAEQAVALQQSVQEEVQHLPTSDLHQLHARVNDILCQAARRAFPAKRAEDNRVSANVAYRASARHVWCLYAAMKQPRVATAGRVLQQWRNATLFVQASRALKEQSRLLKQAAFQAKLQAAEEAATAGDQRTLHSIVRSLTPSHRKLFSRLRNSEGKLLSKAEEARALADQGRATYALFPDLPIAGPLTQELLVTDGEIADQFRAIKAGKAVPNHIAPAVLRLLRAAFRGGFPLSLPGRELWLPTW